MSSACAPTQRTLRTLRSSNNPELITVSAPALDDARLGDRDDELPTARAVFALLRQHFVGVVPDKQQHVIGPPGQELARRKDEQLVVGHVAALLVGAAVHG